MKKTKQDTPRKGSWAETVNTLPLPARRKWPSLAFPDKVNPQDWITIKIVKP